MTFLFCSAPLMYFDKPGSDLLCAISAHHCPFLLVTFSPDPQITSPWSDILFHTMALNWKSLGPKKKKKKKSDMSLYYRLIIFLLNIKLEYGKSFMK